jgi:hypothetical protein
MKFSFVLPATAAIVAVFVFSASAAPILEAAGVQAVGEAGPEARLSAPVPPPPLVLGRARMLHPATHCDVPPFAEGGPGIPYFVADGVPQVGQAFRVQWTTKPTVPAPPPAWPALLFVSFHRVSIPLAAIGASGCVLGAAPEFVMVPHAGSILTQDGGRIYLDWTPGMAVVGLEFYSQLLVQAPNTNAAGFLLSPVLHAQVGSP